MQASPKPGTPIDAVSRLPGRSDGRRMLSTDFIRTLGWEPLSPRNLLMTTSQFDRITINPKQCGGQPCVRGMRIRVRDVLDMLANGASEAQILADFPDLRPDDIRASIAYAVCYLDDTPLVAS